MTGVVMDQDTLKPYDVVLFFQSCLNAAGNPIVFTEEGELPRQRGYARRLIAACKCNRKEVKDLIRVYCSNEWWVKNQPTLYQIVKRLDHWRSLLEGREQYAKTWEEL